MMYCIVRVRDDVNISSLKVSKHVDQSGKIYLPYLHEWSHPKSDLLGWHDLTPPQLFTIACHDPRFGANPDRDVQRAASRVQQAQAGAVPAPAAAGSPVPGLSPHRVPGGWVRGRLVL